MTSSPTTPRERRPTARRQPSPTFTPLTSLELFAGAGGLGAGIHAGGFEHLGLVEWDDYAVETLKKNFAILGLPAERILHADAREVDYHQFAGKVDLLSGGPPCQPFSLSGAHGGYRDERNMFPVFLDAIRVIRPKAVLIENVKGLTRSTFSEYFDYIKLRIEYPFATLAANSTWEEQLTLLRTLEPADFPADERYNLDVRLIDTADFGVPQRRERVIFMALRADLGLQPNPPKPTHSKLALLRDQWVTKEYWKRHGIDPVDTLNDRDAKVKENLLRTLLPADNTLPWVTVRDAISDLPKPVDRGEEPTILNHVQHPGARVYPPCHLGSFPDFPAKALKAGTHGTPGGENILRSDEEKILRYFTTREAGRLQTFPDEWEFLGTWGACIKQLGNAVPVRLGQVYAEAIRDQLRSAQLPQITRTT